MITPNDIATKDFKKVAVGYSPEEVDTFLDDIYEDYERLYKEVQNKEKVKEPVVEQDTDRIKYLEKSIERTLTLAEAAAEETKKAAEADLYARGEKPEALIDWPVDATDYEIVDIFNWQEEAAGMIR